MRNWLMFVTMMVTTLTAGSIGAQQFSLYDDFNGASHLVRADLWNTFDGYSTVVGSGRTEIIKGIDALFSLAAPPSNPKLLIAKRFVLQPGAPIGSSDVDGYSARQASNVAGVQFDVTMLLCSMSAAGSVEAGMQYSGFNAGTSPEPGNRVGDVLAWIRIQCSSTNVPEITWRVFQCETSTCMNSPTLGTGSFGAANIGQEYTLRMVKSGSSFVFTAAGQTQTFPVPGSPTAPPGIPFSQLLTRIDPTTPESGGEFVVGAKFDNVMISQ